MIPTESKLYAQNYTRLYLHIKIENAHQNNT